MEGRGRRSECRGAAAPASTELTMARPDARAGGDGDALRQALEPQSCGQADKPVPPVW